MIALTGASGFVGRAVQKALGPARLVTVSRAPDPGRTRQVAVDLAAPGAASTLAAALKGDPPDCLIHLADVTPWSAAADFSHALAIARTITSACNELRIARLLFLSGWVVYDPAAPVPWDERTPLAPASAYGQSKLQVERHLDESMPRTRVVKLRAASIYGPGQTSPGLIPNLVRRALRGEPLLVKGKATRRDYLFITDVAEALARLAGAEAPDLPDSLNLGSGSSISVEDVARTVRAIVGEEQGREVEIIEEPEPAEGVPIDNRLSIERARGMGLLARPVPFRDGIRATVAWRAREGLS
jgi:nucleoside-diphosphate-sugar epimerase